jgi:hypothetical protein
MPGKSGDAHHQQGNKDAKAASGGKADSDTDAQNGFHNDAFVRG